MTGETLFENEWRDFLHLAVKQAQQENNFTVVARLERLLKSVGQAGWLIRHLQEVGQLQPQAVSHDLKVQLNIMLKLGNDWLEKSAQK